MEVFEIRSGQLIEVSDMRFEIMCVRYSNYELSLSSDASLLGNDIVDYIRPQFDGMRGRTETDPHE